MAVLSEHRRFADKLFHPEGAIILCLYRISPIFTARHSASTGYILNNIDMAINFLFKIFLSTYWYVLCLNVR